MATGAARQCNEIPPLSDKELIVNQILAVKDTLQTLTAPSPQDKELFTLIRNQFESFFSDEFIRKLNLLDDQRLTAAIPRIYAWG